MRLLVIEDDPDLNRQLSTALTDAGYVVDRAFDGEEGHFLGETEPYDAVILDIGLPKMDGISVLESWRRAGRAMPVLILTARDRWSDKVQGFDAGADDYVPKPFHLEEVLARVRALLRRGSGRESTDTAPGGPIVYRHIEIDPARRRVRVAARDVELTANEFLLLSVLLANPGIVFSREALLNRVWSDETFVTVRSVDTLVKRVRKKIESDPAEPDVILTVWGTGYKAADVA